MCRLNYQMHPNSSFLIQNSPCNCYTELRLLLHGVKQRRHRVTQRKIKNEELRIKN